MAKQMSGTVTGLTGRYYRIECPDAPAHLRTLDLVKGQMRGCEVGDRVRLEYQTSASFGLWNVISKEQ